MGKTIFSYKLFKKLRRLPEPHSFRFLTPYKRESKGSQFLDIKNECTPFPYFAFNPNITFMNFGNRFCIKI